MAQRSLFGPSPYPDGLPGHRAMDTSRAAAERVAPRVRDCHVRILKLLHDRGPMTADEIAAALGVGPLSARPRVCKLRSLGEIEDTGQRRATPYGGTAAVWAVSKTTA